MQETEKPLAEVNVFDEEPVRTETTITAFKTYRESARLHSLLCVVGPHHQAGDPALLTIDPEGRFFVRGEEVETHEQTRDALVEFVALMTDKLAPDVRTAAMLRREVERLKAEVARLSS